MGNKYSNCKRCNGYGRMRKNAYKYYFVECTCCKASTPAMSNKRDAVQMWYKGDFVKK